MFTRGGWILVVFLGFGFAQVLHVDMILKLYKKDTLIPIKILTLLTWIDKIDKIRSKTLVHKSCIV